MLLQFFFRFSLLHTSTQYTHILIFTKCTVLELEGGVNEIINCGSHFLINTFALYGIRLDEILVFINRWSGLFLFT